MKIESMNKILFSNVQDLLVSLPDKERKQFYDWMKERDVIGNKILETDVLFQYNAALHGTMMSAQFEKIIEDFSSLVGEQRKLQAEFIANLHNEITTSINQGSQTLILEVEKTIESTNDQVSRLNVVLVNLVDNISTYIDKSISKMLEQVSDEKIRNENELITYGELLKEQLKTEVQGMIIEIVRNDFPDQLKNSVKGPISSHLKKYSEAANIIMTDKFSDMETRVKSMESKVNTGHDVWSVMRVLRDVAVFGGVLIVAKLMHFI